MEKALKQKYEIERGFLTKPWKALTFSEIQRLSGIKSKSYIYKEIARLKKNNLIYVEKISPRAIRYFMKIDNSFSQQYWGFLAEYFAWNKYKKFPFQIIEKLKTNIPTKFFSLIVTGSYAKGKPTKDSDLDIIIIADIEPKKIYAELGHEAEINFPKVHLYVFTSREFLEMLSNKEENYGKESARNNLVFIGGSSYYSILNNAIENGFKG
ncbi:MAG: nucleotidyltransferase domain-containing protein [Nanoarchaeota archaeon]